MTEQAVHSVLLPLVPQQLPPRHTPLEHELLEEHVAPLPLVDTEDVQMPLNPTYVVESDTYVYVVKGVISHGQPGLLGQ